MATKRMVSLKIVDSDAFMDMPQTSQLLYFHLCLRTDDDGFVGNPKKIMRMIGSAENDITLLFTKKFIIGFESGVIVIKHHRINNNWDSHNCKRTQYLDELNQLHIKENGSYKLNTSDSDCFQSVSSLKPVFRIEENRIDKNRINKKIIAETSSAKMPFNQTEYIKKMRQDKNAHIRLIGWYFEKRGSQFPDEEAIKAEIKRWVKDAVFIVKFGQEKIASTHQWVEKKYPEEWNLSTIRKFITEK